CKIASSILSVFLIHRHPIRAGDTLGLIFSDGRSALSHSNTHRKSWGTLAGFACIALAAACSDATNTPSSGTTGTTGATTAGTTGTASTTGSTASSTGTTGSATTTTGTTSTSTGGSDGGSSGTLLWTFDDNRESWTYNDYQTGTDDAGVPLDPTNLSKV